MDKQGIVSVHAGIWFVVGLVLGAAILWFLLSKGIIPPLGAPPTT